MGTTQLKMLRVLLLLIFTEICAAQNDITLSVFTVTSKSMTVQWKGPTGVSSYKITATPKNSSKYPAFAQFSGNSVMGSVISLSPNTVYTVLLEAINNANNVISSANTEVITAPDVPEVIQAYSKHSSSITVEFTEVSGATSYILRAETLDYSFFYEMTVNSTPGTIENLQPYTNYLISVMSVNSGGRSQPSYSEKAKTVVVAPILNATSPTNDTIVVTWPPVEHAVLYTLCIIQDGSTNRIKMNTTNTTVTITNLMPGTNYDIKASAWDIEGRTGSYDLIRQITRPASPNVTDIFLTATGRSLGITVYWVMVQGADAYIAWNTNQQNCTALNDGQCYIIPVECGQNESISVIAYNSAGPSYPSSPAKYITYPCPPENIWVEEPKAGNCSLMWNDVPLVEYYMAFVKRDDGTESSCNTTGTTCQFSCMCGYSYLTTVFPYNAAGSSPSSNVRNYTTIPCCPKNVTIKLVSTDTLEIMWSEVKGAEMYETTAKETRDVIHCNDTAPVCALSDLTCDTAYSVTVTPCSELRGCNRTCTPHTQETAPCSPEILNMTQTNSSSYKVFISTPNRGNTNYTISATGRYDKYTCLSTYDFCELTQLPCGSIFDVMAVASTAVGRSLPGFSKSLETGPCCPTFVNVTQVTQAMTNVTWSPGSGARTYITRLMSHRGHAKCHTMDTHCLMGCITCSTNYSVNLEAISSTGQKSQCTYRGFSSSPCCPTAIKLYRMSNMSLRVYWHSISPSINKHIVKLVGTRSNYTCIAAAGSSYCDIQEEICGAVYTVVVAPIQQNGDQVNFCQPRTFSVHCLGSNPSIMISRRRRSVE